MLMTLNTTNTNRSYADAKNALYNDAASSIRLAKQRWEEAYNALPPYLQRIVDNSLQQAVNEFRRRNSHIKKFSDIPLAEAKNVKILTVLIDGTMQRQLDIFWVLELLNKFAATMVVPIQVYRPNALVEEFLAWDGQHTLILLWLIATHIFEENLDEVVIPVNVYQSHLKAEMRANFISLNSKDGKKMLEPIDLWMQWIYGVRVDNSNNPSWIEAEEKQKYIESAGLFVTAKKFGDDKEPGAITRLQEINKLSPVSVKHLCQYLAHSTKLARPVEEKEMVMMSHFFDRCRIENIDVDDEYIATIAHCTEKFWDSDFSPNSRFWIRASIAYYNWHEDKFGEGNQGKFSKEPVHGFPFMIAQFQKSLGIKIPQSDSRSEFVPFAEDLFQ